MSSVNKVIIIGNLGADPEVRQFSNGGSVTNIAVATSERWTDKLSGEKKELTEWHRIALFNRLGEVAAQYLRKGSKVYIEGSLRTHKCWIVRVAVKIKILVLAIKMRHKVVIIQTTRTTKVVKTTLVVSNQTISLFSQAVIIKVLAHLIKVCRAVAKTALIIMPTLTINPINLINQPQHPRNRSQR